MNFFYRFLIFFTSINVAFGECSLGMMDQTLLYACMCNADSARDFTITVTHEAGKSDEDVKAFKFQSKNDMETELIDIGTRFPNLKSVAWIALNVGKIIPENFVSLTKLEELRIENCQLRQIKYDTFNLLNGLKTLDLQKNELKTLDVNVLKTLTVLISIDLSQNKLISLPADLFRNNKNLNNILLFKNRLIDIPSGLFTNVNMNCCKVIDLRSNLCIDFKRQYRNQTAELNEFLAKCEKSFDALTTQNSMKPEIKKSNQIVDQLFFKIFFGIWS